jgi:uncharacterized beta-barrel protein YwiB (DUF1934 family)
MLKRVRVQIFTDRYEIKGSLYNNAVADVPSDAVAPPSFHGETEHMEMTVEGRYHDDGTRVCISYKESELTGMEGSNTSVSFHKSEPQTLSMLRDGSVKTALVFEQGKRHLCVYQTPVMPFEVCVYTRSVRNAIESEGVLEMDYTVEIRGAQAERTKFLMRVLPSFDQPKQSN